MTTDTIVWVLFGSGAVLFATSAVRAVMRRRRRIPTPSYEAGNVASAASIMLLALVHLLRDRGSIVPIVLGIAMIMVVVDLTQYISARRREKRS